MKRQAKLKQLVLTRFEGNQTDFAKAIDRSQSQVNQWLTGHRNVGDGAARHIEMKLNLPQGYLDEKVSADNVSDGIFYTEYEADPDFRAFEIKKPTRTKKPDIEVITDDGVHFILEYKNGAVDVTMIEGEGYDLDDDTKKVVKAIIQKNLKKQKETSK